MDKPLSLEPSAAPVPAAQPASYKRFAVDQRIEHIFFLVSFTILGITGLAQRYAASPIALAVLQAFGGIENTRKVHHVAAFIMLWVSVYHVIAVLYRVYVLRVPWTMMPVIDDFRHLIDDMQYWVGIRKHKAYYGRYNYAEKVEYLAVVWGTFVMALTGFVMWNPITTTKYLPGQVIPAAKVAHSGEAVLAVMAIIIWHMYHVHLKYFNKSMFTGMLTHEEMEEEHPAELEQIRSGKSWKRPEESLIRKRQRIFAPFAVVLAAVLSLGVIYFVRVEPATAIAELPKGETALIYDPVTPTPRPTPIPSPTPAGGVAASANTWDGEYVALFRNRCGGCHVSGNLGELSLATYQNALKGGKDGPAIVPGDPDSSLLVKIQAEGGHPGQLSADELAAIIAWIKAGAPEK